MLACSYFPRLCIQIQVRVPLSALTPLRISFNSNIPTTIFFFSYGTCGVSCLHEPLARAPILFLCLQYLLFFCACVEARSPLALLLRRGGAVKVLLFASSNGFCPSLHVCVAFIACPSAIYSLVLPLFRLVRVERPMPVAHLRASGRRKSFLITTRNESVGCAKNCIKS